MRLYRAICAWLEADAAAKAGGDPDLQPEGNNFSQAEHAHSYSAPPELHIATSRQSLDDDDGGTYRKRIGFTRNP